MNLVVLTILSIMPGIIGIFLVFVYVTTNMMSTPVYIVAMVVILLTIILSYITINKKEEKDMI